MKRKTKKTIPAQQLKRALEIAAKKIGKRKKIEVGAAFVLVVQSVAEAQQHTA